MSRNEPYDAIVVGAGPAGSSTAAVLAGRGFSVLLVDAARFPREKACGEYTSPETETVLSRIGALDLVAPVTNRLTSMHLISPAGKRFALDYGSASGRSVLATLRCDLDAALVRHAMRSGVEVREQTKVTALTLRDGQVGGVVIRAANGTSSEITARIVIGADGVHSVVARSLGLRAPVKWPRSLGMVARYRGHNGLDGWGEMHVSAGGYAGLAPLRNGLVNVGLVMPESKARRYNGLSAVERFERFAFSFPGVAERLEGAERVTRVRGMGPIGARVSRVSGAGFLLVGDAAGFFDPFTGEGVYNALRGAELAANVAAKALDINDLSARRLGEYDGLRRREFADKELVCKLVQLFVGVPPLMDYVARRLAARERPRQVLTGVLGDYADARSALTPGYLWSILRP